jgi:Ca-activated chloride channel family protein
LFKTASSYGSPANALRDYQGGRYDQALKEYEQLLERKADDPRLHYNAGASAYRGKRFDEAMKQFDEALNSPDLKLQSSAYYNRGNTLYYLGEQVPDPSKRTETWNKSLQDFQSSMKLNPQDADAKHNYEFVKRRLEELKQQQQQQKQSKQDKSDQQQDKDQQQQQQQQQQQDQQDKDQQKQDSSQQQQQQKDQQQKQDQQQQQAQQQKQDGQKQQQAAQPQDQKQQPDQQPADQADAEQKEADEKDQQAAAGEMTPQQARQLLDAQKGDEMMLPPQSKRKPTEPNRPFRDW